MAADDSITVDFRRLEQLMDERDRRYEAKFSAQDEKTSLALAASKEAVIKAEMATEKRFENVNEFRKTLSDQTVSFVTRVESDVKFSAVYDKFGKMEKEVDELQKARSESTGKNQTHVFLAGITLTIVAIGIAAASLFLKK